MKGMLFKPWKVQFIAEHPERYHCCPNPFVFAYTLRQELPDGTNKGEICSEKD